VVVRDICGFEVLYCVSNYGVIIMCCVMSKQLAETSIFMLVDGVH